MLNVFSMLISAIFCQGCGQPQRGALHGLTDPGHMGLITRRSLVRVQPPLSVPRDNLGASRGYFMAYVNSRGFIAGENTVGS